MTLRLHNTLTRTKEPFVPLDPANVRMYVCGPTVYDFAHIGNARPAIVFDVLFRLLRHVYGEAHVTYVRNITDIDDKINARAMERAKGGNTPVLDVLRAITEETYRVYQEDTAALGNLPASATPRATESVPAMIAMIQALIAGGHAYAAQGHVLFDVASKPDYGKLAHRSTDDMIAGARIDVAPYKKGAMDFVLWKPSDDATPGWESPWGRGRPGWHLECSAMIASTFHPGTTIDIHAGGIDLMFPHHENEIAQSECAHHGAPLARYWLHNGFLNVEGEKMSKSLGNFVTIRELLATDRFGGRSWPGEVLRVNMLKRHYRLPMDWSVVGLSESSKLLAEWLMMVPQSVADIGRARTSQYVSKTLVEVLSDDLNTHLALQEIHHLRNQAAHNVSSDFALTLAASLNFLGLLPIDIEETLARLIGRSTLSDEEIHVALEARNAARKAKDFKESDRIRDALLSQGIVLKDGPTGTTWEVKK